MLPSLDRDIRGEVWGATEAMDFRIHELSCKNPEVLHASGWVLSKICRRDFDDASLGRKKTAMSSEKMEITISELMDK